MADLLLHTCCAPCSIYSVEHLRAQGKKPLGFFYNPNIHPFREYKKRLETLRSHAAATGWPLVERTRGYDLDAFLGNTAGKGPDRCAVCYGMRLRATALEAADRGIPAFTTTLLISPYQNRGLICDIGRRLGNEYGLEFLAEDFRPGFRKSQKQAREAGLYIQPYCGCIYSERDRYDREGKR